jgi:hypothetical protein
LSLIVWSEPARRSGDILFEVQASSQEGKAARTDNLWLLHGSGGALLLQTQHEPNIMLREEISIRCSSEKEQASGSLT